MTTIEVNNNEYHFKYVDMKTPLKLSPSLELCREKEFLKIKWKFREILKKYNIEPKKRTLIGTASSILSRYIMYNHSHGKITQLKDGFFHYTTKNDVIAKDIEYVFKNVSSKLATKIADELDINNLFKESVSKLKSQKLSKKKAYKKFNGEIVAFESLGVIKHKLTIPKKIYKNLEKRYKEYKTVHKHTHKFDDLVYMLLLRYNTVDSGGHQWGMPFAIREKFRKLGFNFECFASSMNHFYHYYCSMFYDIEKYFMSLGPFQNIEYIKGTYMANPPYELHLLNIIVKTFTKSLSGSKNLTFMYGLPDWERFGEKFYFIDESKRSKYHKWYIKFEPYKYPWHDFMSNDKVMRIPSSYRIVLSNHDIDIQQIKDITGQWKNHS
jgi:hypothetical protein